MKPVQISIYAAALAALFIGVHAPKAFSGTTSPRNNDAITAAVQKGVKWLVSVQGKDGGWGQDGGETSYVRQGERLESNGNDVANTAVAASALLHAGNTPTSGEYRESLRRAIEFIERNVEESPGEGLAVTTRNGTQIQRKLGPYIDTFLTSKLLAELDGNMGSTQANARVRQDLQKCVAKIEKNQLKDGSWNVAGGWAPILGTSMASRSLYDAKSKGVAVSPTVMARIDEYTVNSGKNSAAGGAGRGYAAASAGVSLYQGAQELEQLSRTEKDRVKNAQQIDGITKELSNAQFVNGYGSIGGEEFFSYLNISDSLHRAGGPEWEKWNSGMQAKVLKLQNEDGTWAGHHCITGRVAVTSAAMLLLVADRDVVVADTRSKKN
jgi:Squalene-hopene cyclase C-terminal domain/Prenyltransferase and squalene oxidase repeat